MDHATRRFAMMPISDKTTAHPHMQQTDQLQHSISVSAMVPPGIVPYLQLIRLDRPRGFFYFWFPHLHGTILTAILLQQPLKQLVTANLALLVGTFFMRGATCAWNDIVDAPFDRQVTRTKNRPMARGAIPTASALVFAGCLSILALATLRYLPPVCSIYVLPAIAGWFLYPLSKRVTNFPQVVLGFPMAWGVLMGAGAMGADPLDVRQSQWSVAAAFGGIPLERSATKAIIYFYGANFAWTLCYETIYSFQDIKDDIHAGVLNIALLLGKRGAKPFLTLVAAVVVATFAAVGQLANAGPLYYVGCVFAVSVALVTKITRVDLSKPASCAWWFCNGGIITGTALTGGLLFEYLVQSVNY